MDVVAVAASLTRVGRWDKNNRNPSNISFVLNEKPQLIKSPIVCPSALLLIRWFCVQRLPDIGQVFHTDNRAILFSGADNRFRDIVICPLLKAPFTSTKPSRAVCDQTESYGAEHLL